MNSAMGSGGARLGRQPGEKILVTGSSGVVGRRVMEELRRRGLAEDVIAFHGDISSRADIESAVSRAAPLGACLHLAAVVPVTAADADPVRTYEVNAIGTGHIVDAIGRRSKNSFVLHCSTSHVYAPCIAPLSESAPLEPVSTYGRSKLAAELLATDVASRQHIRLGIARVFSLWAEDQRGSFLYPSLQNKFSSVRPGDSVRVTGGNNIRDFLHADEVARLLVELMLRETRGVVNVASGTGTSVLEFAQHHAPDGVTMDSDDVVAPTSIVADTSRLSEVLRD